MSNPEDQWIEDCKNACPYCGGSGHKDDIRADLTRQTPKVKALADEIRSHVNLDENHEVDLIPISTHLLLKRILSALEE